MEDYPRTLQGFEGRFTCEEAYLDEFVFRFGRRTSRHRGKLFYRLVQHSLATGPETY